MLLESTEIKKIAIFRALQLGDMLCSIPAIKALRASYPAAEISLIGLPWGQTLVDRFNHYFNRFIRFPGYPGLPEQDFSPSAYSDFLSEMVSEKFDLVLQMQGNGTLVNPMVETFGGKYTAGFSLPGIYAPKNNLFMQYPDGLHEINRHLKLMEFLGIKSSGTALEFPIYPQDREELEAAGLTLEKGKYICVHPGSRGAGRRWDPSYFAKLADMGAAQGLTPVITGTKDELEIVYEVEAKMVHKPVIAAAKTSLGAIAVLLEGAAGLVSNCTGVSHIAAALKTPSVVISMDGEPERWVPLNTDLHKSIDWTQDPDFEKVCGMMREMLQLNGSLV